MIIDTDLSWCNLCLLGESLNDDGLAEADWLIGRKWRLIVRGFKSAGPYIYIQDGQ